MKRFILIALLLLLPFTLKGANVWYCSADGTSWAKAKNYMGHVTEHASFADGDTIVVGKGALGGTMNHRSICYDSTMYYEGYERELQTQPKCGVGVYSLLGVI